MKGFFGRMSFPRAVILFCTLGSLVLGVLVYQRSRRLDEVLSELKAVRDVGKEIQINAYRLSELQRSADSETFTAQTDPLAYIRETGAGPNVNLGQLDITSNTQSFTKGIEDTIYKITVMDPLKQRYPRIQIGNFLYKLEDGSPRVKVTRLRLTPAVKVQPGQIGKDLWNFEAELRTRTKLETAPAAGTAGNKG